MTALRLDDSLQVQRRGSVLSVSLWYPGIDDNATAIEIGLFHVRAADDIRITYDFERDGWSISQDQDATEHGTAPDWQEVAFCQAWEKLPARREREAEAVRIAVEAERERAAAASLGGENAGLDRFVALLEAAVKAEREAWRSAVERCLGPSAARDAEEARDAGIDARGQK